MQLSSVFSVQSVIAMQLTGFSAPWMRTPLSGHHAGIRACESHAHAIMFSVLAAKTMQHARGVRTQWGWQHGQRQDMATRPTGSTSPVGPTHSSVGAQGAPPGQVNTMSG